MRVVVQDLKCFVFSSIGMHFKVRGSQSPRRHVFVLLVPNACIFFTDIGFIACDTARKGLIASCRASFGAALSDSAFRAACFTNITVTAHA